MASPKKKAPGAPQIRSRIVGNKDVDPRTLTPHPLNFRRHPQHQKDALRGSMQELGWVKGVLVNKTTGRILDGHARVEEAISQGLGTIPCTFVELSEDEERLALAVLDPITELAVRDEAVLSELLAGIITDDAALNELLQSMNSESAWDPDPLKEQGLNPAEALLLTTIRVTCEEVQVKEVMAAIESACSIFTGVTIAKS